MRNIKLENMRLHIGAHIVKKGTHGPVSGFCGIVCNNPVSIIFSSGTGDNFFWSTVNKSKSLLIVY